MKYFKRISFSLVICFVVLLGIKPAIAKSKKKPKRVRVFEKPAYHGKDTERDPFYNVIVREKPVSVVKSPKNNNPVKPKEVEKPKITRKMVQVAIKKQLVFGYAIVSKTEKFVSVSGKDYKLGDFIIIKVDGQELKLDVESIQADPVRIELIWGQEVFILDDKK